MREDVYRVVDADGVPQHGYNNPTGLYMSERGAWAAVRYLKHTARRYGRPELELRVERAVLDWHKA